MVGMVREHHVETDSIMCRCGIPCCTASKIDRTLPSP